jgi:hypothetical protein
MAWDPIRQNLMVWQQAADNADGSSNSNIVGYYVVPGAERLTVPIPLTPPRAFRTSPIATRLVGDLGRPVGGVIVTGAVTDTSPDGGAVFTLANAPTDTYGYARLQLAGELECIADISVSTFSADTAIKSTGGGSGGVFSTGGGGVGLPFVMPPLSALYAPPRQVFAHYFYTFPLSINNKAAAVDYYNVQYLDPAGEGGSHLAYGGWLRQRPLPVPVSAAVNWKQLNMQAEVNLALSRGITGFTFDILSLADALSPTGRLQTMLLAAATVDSRFKIVPMLDMSSLGAGLTTAQAASIIQAINGYPAVFRLLSGNILMSAFNAPLQNLTWWTSVISTLAGVGINVDFLPVILGGASDAGTLDPISYGVGAWGTGTAAAAAALQPNPAIAHGNSLKYMMPILTQQFRPKSKNFWEANNSQCFRNSWMSAINGGSDMVQLVTWNDFSESGQIEPCTDATLNLNIGTGFFDLNAYYSAWFLTGTPPVITMDALYFVYRRMPLAAAHPNQPDDFSCIGGTPSDQIEVLSFLTAPGTVSVTIGGSTSTFSAPAGLSSHLVALAPGVPLFKLVRAGITIITGSGPIQIYGLSGDPAGTLDFTYWSGKVTTSGIDALTPLWPDPLPDGTVGVAYSFFLTASGGVRPYTYSHTSGTLPVGISLNGSTGELSSGGVPLTTAISFAANTFGVTDSS